MKNLFFGLIAAVFMVNLSWGQQKDTLIVELKGLFESEKVGYYTDNDKFIALSESRAHKLFVAYFDFRSVDDISIPVVKKLIENNNNSYYLFSKSKDGRLSLALPLASRDGLFFIEKTKPSIKCETIGCSNSWGCEAQSAGNTLSCTQCFGDCKKTTEIKQSLFLSEF